MSSRSSIEWTETTRNPTTGCDQVSAGCENCYALTLAKRLKAMSCEPLLGPLTALDLAGIGWVIVGGESGPHARPVDARQGVGQGAPQARPLLGAGAPAVRTVTLTSCTLYPLGAHWERSCPRIVREHP